LRRIDLRWVNLLLLLILLALSLRYRDALSWAAGELPLYLQGKISSPVERQLYVRARRLIESGEDLSRAREMLERSITIDPNSDAIYWMAEYHRRQGETEAALDHYRRYLAFDPTRVDAYLHCAELLRSTGETAQARQVLSDGAAYFADEAPRLKPQPDPSVDMRFNQKAIQLSVYYRDAAERLSAAAGELEQ